MARRDMNGLQHVHPELGTGGTWTVLLDPSEPGEYRVFADLAPAGQEQSMTPREAHGNLVALRDGGPPDCLRVRPAGRTADGTTRPGPEITFHTSAPSAPSARAYRLFLDFRHDAAVRTTAFTAAASVSKED